MTSSSEGQSIIFEVVGGKKISVPSGRIPAGIYVSVNVDSKRCWKSAVRVLSSDSFVVWGDTVTLSPDVSPKLSVEIRASFELGRMLGRGELVGKLEMSWEGLLDRGDEPFESLVVADISFPPIRGVCPSLTLKVASGITCANDGSVPFDSIDDCRIARDTDVGHIRLCDYMRGRGGVQILDDAMNHFELVLDQCPVDHPDHAAALTNLAWARLQGYIRKDLQGIYITTTLLCDALALRPRGHPDRPVSLYHLAEALIWRYSYHSITVDIFKAAQLCHELLSLCSEDTYLRSIAIGKNGVDYVVRACNNLPIDASDEDIYLRRIVLKLCPPGNQHNPSAIDKLAKAVKARFRQCGFDELDRNVQLGREVVSMCPEGNPNRVTYLINFAVSLRSRFDHQGGSHDLDEVISLYEEALPLRPVGHEYHDASLDGLGRALLTRFNECNDIDDINRAAGLFRKALASCSPGRPNRDTKLNNLAAALITRHDKLHASEDLDEAIDLCRKSLLLLQQDDHPERHRNLFNLSMALCSRFAQTRKKKDVEEAIGLCQDSLVALPPLHADRYFSYKWLKEAYLSRYRILPNAVDLSLAVENFRLASNHPTQGFPERIKEAIQWARQSEFYEHESALEAYQTCLDLFNNHVAQSSIILGRNTAIPIDSAESLPMNATSCAIRRNDLQRGVELEEQGRDQQRSLACRLRAPLDDLKSINIPLAHRLSELSKSLSDARNSAGNADRDAADRAETEYRRLTTEWEAVVAEIRNLQGFSRFLLPPSYEDLQVAARHGPVIILNASEYSCNAIIVSASGKPHHVPFPSLALTDLKMLKKHFANVIRDTARVDSKEPRTALIALLRTIWDEVMQPIVNVLQQDLKLPSGSRIWLCPTAAFTSIPLHAAHPFRMNADRSGREPSLEDLYICSYTPTLSSLIRARQTMTTRVTPSFAAIGQDQPGAGQGTVLAAVETELELVHKHVPPNVKFTHLSGDKATQAGALEALRCNTWVHLACHGKQDYEHPSNSRFVMRNKPLTLLDIVENDAPQAEFAFLSGCHAARGDEKTPDEVIHLASGVQFSGFKSVVGTLWEVDDAVAKHVVEAFYENMFKDMDEGVMNCTKAAWALNKTTYAVKKTVPLEQRIGFIHTGL
ncbi:CHAT domain-containing protein [Suillus plorans]|uniref:CHAT domain-containing protein n=1 Tax=Suillus plorans TaxID=116603 RepID=A0A9P7DSR5_9AGAM|nr:CHAT domain-containing protein [Suillus plorans]KAG1802119.1 CHAT domain-containing protein [Suillus plorans]